MHSQLRGNHSRAWFIQTGRCTDELNQSAIARSSYILSHGFIESSNCCNRLKTLFHRDLLNKKEKTLEIFLLNNENRKCFYH